MYMFFWFFKQLYYCLRRIFKSGLLLLVLFFIFFLLIFIKPSYAVNSTDIPQAVLNEANNPRIGNGGNNIILKSKSTEHYYILLSAYDISSSDTAINGSWSYGNYVSGNTNYLGFTNPLSSRCRSYTTDNDGATWFYSRIWDSSTSNVATISLEFFDIVYSKTNVLAHNLEGYNNNSVIFSPTLGDPFITNDSSTIINFSFNYLKINAVNKPFTDYYELRFTYPDVNTSYTGSVEAYKYVDNGFLFFSIPKSWFTDDIVIRTGSRISFDLIRYHREGNAVTSENYSLGSYILDLTAQAQDEINEDSNKQLLSDINKGQQQTTEAINNLNNSQQETTNAVNDLNNTVSDSTVEDSSIFLPSLQVNDPTQAGINNIFDLLYNAFTAGDSADIVLPFPFTNKSITIPGNLTYNVLHNNGGDILIHIIHIFWRYQIFSFIVYDIYQKMKSIQEGNIEDVQKDNIKGEML